MDEHAEIREPSPLEVSNCECTVEEFGLKHELDSAPDITDDANTGETRSGKSDLKGKCDPTMMTRDEDKNAEKPTLVSSKDTRQICDNSGMIQVGLNHPLGMISSANTLEKLVSEMF